MAAGEILILGTIVDASRKNTSGYANQIRDLRLNKNQQEINQLFQREIIDLKNQSPQEEIDVDNLKSEIYQYILQHLEDILPKDEIQHIFLTIKVDFE